jgi:ubiquinone/menaquinone biosynthesis C-methylase UbiE
MRSKYLEQYMGVTPDKCNRFEDRHQKVLDYLSKSKYDVMLDIGCGDGNFSIKIKDAGHAKEIYGIEITEKGVISAINNGVKAFKVDIDVENLPFEDRFFDSIFAGEVIEHLYDTDHFLDEIYRVLKPGGILVITTPNLASIHNRVALLFGYQPFPMGVSARMNIGRAYEPSSEQAQSLDHIRVMTMRSLRDLLRIHDFKIISVKGSCASLPETMRYRTIFSTIDKLFTTFPGLSYRTITVVEK